MSSFAKEVGLNSLPPKYLDLFTPKYAQFYNDNIVGKFLGHQVSMKTNRTNPTIAGFGGEPGPEIGKIWDTTIPVTEPEGEIRLRVYEPKNLDKQKERRPCYIDYHGGGWCIGGIGDDEPFLRHVVDRLDAIVIDVGYRLAPEYRYPVGLEDCWTAFNYVRTHPDQFHIDETRIALGGFSAGGHIGAMISHRARDLGISGIALALLVIPVTDANALDEELFIRPDCPYRSWVEHNDGPFLSYHRMSYFYRYFLPTTIPPSLLTDPRLSPIHNTNFKNLPPTLIVCAEVDVLRDEGLAYAKKMRDEGDGWTQCWLAHGVPHPFPHQYKATDKAIEFRELAIKRLGEAFEGKLKGKHWETNTDVEYKVAGAKSGEDKVVDEEEAKKLGYGGN